MHYKYVKKCYNQSALEFSPRYSLIRTEYAREKKVKYISSQDLDNSGYHLIY